MLPALYGLLALSALHGTFVGPNRADRAKALEQFTGKPVRAADVRRVPCEGFEEKPTEAACKMATEKRQELEAHLNLCCS